MKAANFAASVQIAGQLRIVDLLFVFCLSFVVVESRTQKLRTSVEAVRLVIAKYMRH